MLLPKLLVFIGIMGLTPAWAQDYNFTFYNGDVVQGKNSEKIKIKTNGSNQIEINDDDSNKTQLPTKSEVQTLKVNVDNKQEKLQRTGVRFNFGYGYQSVSDSRVFKSGSQQNKLMAGFSFISQYDSAIDVGFFMSHIDGQLLGENIDVHLPGIYIGLSQDYWLTPMVGLNLSGQVRGMKGELGLNSSNIEIEAIGAALSFGPKFHFNKFQLLLALEYSGDNYSFDSDDISKDWDKSLGGKLNLAYRF